MKDKTVGVIGMGFVGGSVFRGFNLYNQVRGYDVDPKKATHTFEEVIRCDFVFIAVPTPMKTIEGGKGDPSYINAVLHRILDTGYREETVFILKSTVPIGTTDRCIEEFGIKNLLHSPEFLTERNALVDFITPARHIIGGQSENAMTELEKLYLYRFPGIPVHKMNSASAEQVKYMANCFFAVKIMFFNEMQMLSEAMGTNWDSVMKGVLSDGRIGISHCQVPGHDGDMGFGGKCLVAGTRLRLRSGHVIPIEDVEMGDEVFDGIDGEESYTRVTQIASRTIDRTIRIKARGRIIEGSEDHIHMIQAAGSWLQRELKDVKVGDYVYVPRQPEQRLRMDGLIGATNDSAGEPNLAIDIGPKPNGYVKWWRQNTSIGKDFARLFGLYLAEGCMSGSKYATIWSFGGHEERFADEVCDILVGLGLNPYKRFQVTDGTYGESRCWIVRCRSMGLQALFRRLGTGEGSHSKDTIIFPRHLVPSVVGGWLDGDGSHYDGTVMGHSESTELIAKMDTMLLSVGINAQISKTGKDIKISMRDDVEKVCPWTTRFIFDAGRYKRDFAYASPTCRQVDGGWAVRITSIEEGPPQEVYTIETESHLYVANNILTHNCFPKDINALIGVCEENGIDPLVLKAAWEQNKRLRKNWDWAKIAGAVSQ